MSIPTRAQVEAFIDASMDPSGLRVMQHLIQERLAMFGHEARSVMEMPHVHTEPGALAAAQEANARQQQPDQPAQEGATAVPAKGGQTSRSARAEEARQTRQAREAARPSVKKS